MPQKQNFSNTQTVSSECGYKIHCVSSAYFYVPRRVSYLKSPFEFKKNLKKIRGVICLHSSFVISLQSVIL